MKKIWTKVICIAGAALFMVGSLSACNKEVISAYDIAVENGFVGTEAEWLASLKGSDGTDADSPDINEIYEAAKENGYKGSFLEFLKEYLDVNISEDNDTKQIAENVMSAVSVVCGFQKTVTVSSGIFGTKTETKNYASAGSGVIIDLNKEAGNAYVITNYHVIYDAASNARNHISDEIYLYAYGAVRSFSLETNKDEGSDAMRATYVGGAMDYDIAILKIEGSEYLRESECVAASIATSQETTVGEKVYVIGNPGGDGISVTSGLLSVESEYITMYSTDSAERLVSHRVMRTDAAVNPGNSGGGLFNTRGQLIGITNAKSVEDGVDNICYAIPITLAKNLWENILDNGGVLKRAMLGVQVPVISATAVNENGKLVVKETFIVGTTNIDKKAAAYKKLQYGDVFQSISVNGKAYELYREFDVEDILLTVRKGDTVVVNVLRDGKEERVTIRFDKDEYFTQYN